MAYRICITCKNIYNRDTAPGRRCPRCQHAHDQARPSRQARGYDHTHDTERARRIAKWKPGDPCAIGGEPTYNTTQLDLAHNPDRTGWLGLACHQHNRGHHG